MHLLEKCVKNVTPLGPYFTNNGEADLAIS